MESWWETCRIPEMSANCKTHMHILKAERQCVQMWPKNNHVGWVSDIGRGRLNCSLNQNLVSVFTFTLSESGLLQYGTTIHGGETSSWLIHGCRDKQVSIIQTLDSSYAAFNRSPPWQTTTSRNTYAFQEVSTALLWETWKHGSGWNILRTPKTNPLPGPTGIYTGVEIRECIYEHLAVVQWGQCTDRVQG